MQIYFIKKSLLFFLNCVKYIDNIRMPYIKTSHIIVLRYSIGLKLNYILSTIQIFPFLFYIR